MTAQQDCRTDGRRRKLRAARWNGIDGVEVAEDGRTLTVTFLGKAPKDLARNNFRVDGGRRVTGLRVVEVHLETQPDPELDDRVRLTLDRAGDSSSYTLHLVRPNAYGRPGTEPLPGFDPRYSSATFDFRRDCQSDVDCLAAPCPPGDDGPAPEINYLARDYDTLRRLLLDRMTLTVPAWLERHVPDLGVTLVELLAHAGDQLSYRQDAVATEAYLDTARRRTSVRRHARLVDYAMHDGCNARAWVALETAHPHTMDAGDYRFVSVDLSHLPPGERPELGTVLSDEQLETLPPGAVVEVFEPVRDCPLTVRPEHNAIRFWTWGDEECCLPKGATAATLRDDKDRPLCLKPGDVVIIEEVRGPVTGAPADADPAHRQAVRLTSVTRGCDDLYDQPVLEVTWSAEDALTFSVCLSAVGGPDCCLLTDLSVLRGNVVLVDHGRSLTFCGAGPEEVLVPPGPVAPPSCAPPEFGCPDRAAADPAVGQLQSLISQTGAHQPLEPGDVRGLTEVFGAAAVARAGLGISLSRDSTEHEVVRPEVIADQHTALRTLLAQVSYPPLPRPFRPVLRNAPVTQRVAFPLPRTVAASQAELLRAIPGRVHAWLTDRWRAARDGTPPGRRELAALAVLFTEELLTRLRITERPEPALRELLARQQELLKPKLDRLHVLAGRAAAGVVLGEGIAWEIRQSWGREHAEGLHPGSPALAGSARSALRTDPRAALPAVLVTEQSEDSPQWTPRRDLLASGARDRHFVGELTEENPARMQLRFGDGKRGLAPGPGSTIEIAYRVGTGVAGNVGAEAITHLALCCGAMHDGVTRVRNPLAAVGGVEPEPIEQVRQLAPLAPRRGLVRAVTAADYARLAGEVPGVQRAAAQLRWNGSGREAHVAIDPLGEASPSSALLAAVYAALEPARRIGHRLFVGPAALVPLDIELFVCVDHGYQRGHVLAALRAVFGTRRLPGGALGFFHPDALSFGEPVRVSRLIARAAAVPGVVTAQVRRLRRRFGQDNGELAAGLLALGPLEIAQLDNDPDRPENGRLSFVLGGAR
ncbi:putative baseplate assembly protein [Crossiella sp. SN42]|uniref:putative baseplate assembly protein n=1 Tax=Crossiella sp. SN42 TaxID=2944808 RepID=UPI00207C1CB8|nr:putative baseplate assembly protein [Crossiella sp. SN42]MCO1577844.1 putative baseplate assembly protein [Crossiella sp. SN42]